MIRTFISARHALRGGTALKALALMGAGIAAGGVAAPAVAQDSGAASSDQQSAEPTNNEDIVVTGTLFRRSDLETASPVTVITAETMAQRGQNTVSDAILALSANGAGTITSNWNAGGNFATGATAVSLRGLTVSSTVTLFDGLRMAPYPLGDDGRRNFTDLNTIPSETVESIQVLKDGASSTYGADAVAGVVNVITKKEIRGFHLNASNGISQRGDAGEQRLAGTFGYGRLNEDGFNVYVSAEYQHNDALYYRDRDYPYNSADYSRLCGTTGSCRTNGVINGIQADGSFGGLGSTRVAAVRAYDSTNTIAQGDWQLLNTSAGCGSLATVTLNNSQRRTATQNATTAYNGYVNGATQCQQDLTNEYQMSSPRIDRLGASGKITFRPFGDSEAYVSANYYQVETFTQATSLTLNGSTAAGGTQYTVSNLALPVYVCARGTTTCDATNGTLNPNNPYAAQGQVARISYRYDRPRQTITSTNSFRGAAGIAGSLGGGWGYDAAITGSHITLNTTYKNYIYAQHLLDVIADGSYNFVDPSQNSEEDREYLAPTQRNRSTSDMFQAQAFVTKDVMRLPGGALQVAIGGAVRYEALDNPSANAPDNDNPTERYYSINAVGASGQRWNQSAFGEITAPVLEQLELNASGRYDNYSTGQRKFSPKFTAKFTPIQQLAIRGTYSQGFRIPSFNEAYGLPTTGYITTVVDPNTSGGAAFIAAHGGNTYSTASYSVGLTATGNPDLKPERSRTYTAGAIFKPVPRVTLTADYYNIRIKDLITGADYTGVFDAYYANNGVVDIDGITVAPQTSDPDNPNALPLLGFIDYSYTNADLQETSGLDFSANIVFPISGGLTWTSSADATYVIRFQKTFANGDVQRYDGSLSPCDVTSCSGTPKWRGNWQNTLDFNGQGSLSLNAYHSGGYDQASTDYGGVVGDCAASIGASVAIYRDGSVVACRVEKFISFDLTASIKVADRFTLYGNVINLFDVSAPYDPGTYGGRNYNPAWASSGIMGRYFRAGAKFSF